MKAIIGTILSTLIAGLILFHLQQVAPNVRYTLSERLPVPLDNSNQNQTENVQQIEVKNIGNEKAERIRVSINRPIVSPKVFKYSEADAPQLFPKNDSFELVYPELPPQGSFKLAFRVSGGGIEYRDLSISHSAGRATEALAKQEPTLAEQLLGLAWFPLFLLYLFLAAIQLRQTLISKKVSRIENIKVEYALKLNKPWYVSSGTWSNTLKEGLERSITSEHLYAVDIANSTSYKLLSLDRPASIEEDRWKVIQGKAVEVFTKLYESATDLLPEKKLLHILGLKKPEHFPLNKWEDLREKAEKRYVNLRERYIPNSLDKLKGLLQESKSDEISDALWLEYLDDLKRRYYALLSDKVYNTKDPIDFLNKQDLSILNHTEKSILETDAYRIQRKNFPDFQNRVEAEKFLQEDKPSWMGQTDYSILVMNAERLIEYDKKNLRVDSLQSLFVKLLHQRPVGDEKPEHLRGHEWEQIKELEKEIIDAKKIKEELTAKETEYNSKSKVLSQEQTELRTLKDRIQQQLNLIHSVISDPTSIERIEDYNDIFAPGNFANLKKLAEVLREGVS